MTTQPDALLSEPLGCPFCGAKAHHDEEMDEYTCNDRQCPGWSVTVKLEAWNRRAYLAQGDGGWIKCSERLPEVETLVMWLLPNKTIEIFALHDDGVEGDGWGWVKKSYGVDTPTHWRPLPLPPADDTGE